MRQYLHACIGLFAIGCVNSTAASDSDNQSPLLEQSDTDPRVVDDEFYDELDEAADEAADEADDEAPDEASPEEQSAPVDPPESPNEPMPIPKEVIAEHAQQISSVKARSEALDWFLADKISMKKGLTPKGWMAPPLHIYQAAPKSHAPNAAEIYPEEVKVVVEYIGAASAPADKND